MSTEHPLQSARTDVSTETPPATRREERVLFEELQAALGRREFGSPPEGRHLAQWVRDSLKRTLGNARIDVRSGSGECDLLVEDTIGIEIIDGLSRYGKAGLRRHLETVGRDCEYLIVFVHALPGDSQDAWWMIKRRCTPRSLGVTDIAFVKPEGAADETEHTSPLLAWLLLGPGVVFLAAYLAVGLTEATRISNHPMLQLIVPAIGITVLLILVLKSFGDA